MMKAPTSRATAAKISSAVVRKPRASVQEACDSWVASSLVTAS